MRPLAVEMTRRVRFVQGQLGWMLATAFILTMLDSLTFDIFFIVSVIGLLVLSEVTTPLSVTPTWRRRLRWVILVSLVAFVALLVRRILAVLSLTAVPF